MTTSTRKVLDLLQAGRVTSEEANRLLAALDGAPAPPALVAADAPAADAAAGDVDGAQPSAEVAASSDLPPTAHEALPASEFAAGPASDEAVALTIPQDPAAALRHVWRVPFVAALVVLVLSLIALVLGYQAQNVAVNLGFSVAGSIFILAALVAGAALWSRRARWLVVRVEQPSGHLLVSLPVPLALVGWLMRLARRWQPPNSPAQLDAAHPDEPLLVATDHDGASILIYFG